MAMSRREFIGSSAALSMGLLGLQSLTTAKTGAAAKAKSAKKVTDKPGYGPLVPDPMGVLDLPAGFHYQVVSEAGQVMSDGLRVPAMPDGMAAFPGPDGVTLIVRNHELEHEPGTSAFGWSHELLSKVDPDRIYDRGHHNRPAYGGTTTLVFDTRKQQVKRQFLSLVGTVRNCSGGPTPWGSWISCEEYYFNGDDYYAAAHGYCFEVPASAQRKLVKPRPLRGMGRFCHEAVAVDEPSGAVYLTEDRHNGLIYRFLPREPGRLHEGGKLQALAIQGHPSRDMRNWPDEDAKQHVPSPIQVGSVMPVRWIDLEHIDTPDDDLRFRGFEQGAARFARGEGMWADEPSIFFACTNGGREKLGQIWRYVPSAFEGRPAERDFPGRLELFIEPNDGDLVQNCDNLTVSPRGDLIVCEDSAGTDRLIGVTMDGRCYELARNAYNDSELTGAIFTPDGTTLLVNMQTPGLTLAITGPWSSGG